MMDLVRARHELLDGGGCGPREGGGLHANVPLAPEDADRLVDLRAVMELSPMSVHSWTPVPRVHELFCNLGLRHLFVCDARYQLVGVITRKDLLPEVLEAEAAGEVSDVDGDHAARAASGRAATGSVADVGCQGSKSGGRHACAACNCTLEGPSRPEPDANS
eukprot:CAMPEP_0206013276 /NCGR_PEP_ID=MMETSP1464-20131121/16209_1 /ASSEMBLY_ACC=CAM_ASM_001124 /TAXON_ID=119497 /ORGANISM="Exanthemachrysis gayraliae, Strain RCC1523" /LENGTH=161 /DNA_ID=CAMNT_0053386989 /DNA_START=12 /DNA_END=498 /DNA_ORIENTATION=+